MTYRQLTSRERYMISALRKQGIHTAEITRNLGRHRSTICREVQRNASRWDGRYRPSKTVERTRGRRVRSRKKSQFGPDAWRQVEALLLEDFSPEQIAGHLRAKRVLSISHETIYRHVRQDRRRGGHLHEHLRLSDKQRRKRYRSQDSRGQLRGKRKIEERPAVVEGRRQLGHWEVDTVMGKYGTKPCIVTLVERKAGFLLIGKIKAPTTAEANRSLLALIERHSTKFKTITADNGTEFHGHQEVEDRCRAKFYFATPYHSWERGSNANTNGLIRQYLPKGCSMVRLTQARCNEITDKLNNRPRKRHAFRTPAEVFDEI